MTDIERPSDNSSMFLGMIVFLNVVSTSQPPRFDAYRSKVFAARTLALPILTTPEEKRYRLILQRAVTKGYGVVEGETESERIGPNFAGRMLLVQWGCGTNCMQAAVIDARDGSVLPLPKIPSNAPLSAFMLGTGSADLRTLKFRTSSRLLGIPNVKDGKTYFFVLEGHAWKALSSVVIPDAFRCVIGLQVTVTSTVGSFR